tara:strand:+ start:1989 stop:3341 length:1353 start_codon:yes stop_codon:yes gene_type:complete
MNSKITKNIDILVVANLEHASPRIPGLSQYMCSLNDSVRVITPIRNKNFKEKWAINNFDEKNFKIIDAPYSGDLLQILRKLFWSLGFTKNLSLTEQLKNNFKSKDQNNFWSKLKAKIPEWLFHRFQELFAIPDLEITWYKSALRTANIEIKKKRPDFIISSSPFITSHLVASKIAKKHKITWIADFRDTWSNNPVYSLSKLRNKLDRYLEKKIISQSNLITTVSEAYSKKLKQIHKNRINIIPNGYTSLNLSKKSVKSSTVLNIVYTGTLYEGFQNFPIFLGSVRKTIDMGLIKEEKLRINFYGRYISKLQELIEDFDLSGCVFQNGTVSRKDSFTLQQKADLLLFFKWEGSEDGASHLKLYEYLGSMSPIFVVGTKIDGTGTNQKIIESTNSGFIGIGSNQISNILVDLYNKHINGSGIPHEPNMMEIKKHSYFERGKVLRDLLFSIKQ